MHSPAVAAALDRGRWETLAQIAAGSLHDPEFAGLRTLEARGIAVVLDVGANRGQSIASLKSLFPLAKVHAFEPNPMFTPLLDDLREIYGDGLAVHRCALGATRASGAALHLPWAGDTPYLEEATLRHEFFDKPHVVDRFAARGGLRLVEIAVDVVPGDDFALAPDLVKIDVEGAEAAVVTGLRATLERHHPVMLVENGDFHVVTGILAPLGYAPWRWDVGAAFFLPVTGSCVNTFYFPWTPAQVAVS